MTNIFSDFRHLILAALDDLATQGGLPRGLDLGRIAVEPPRDPAHGDLASNAAMVLAGTVKEHPMALAERIGAALAGRELATGDYRGSGFTVAPAPPSEIRRLAAASASMSSLFRPIPPGRCMLGTAAARSSGMRSPDCSPRQGSRCSASITSTTPAPRSISSRGPLIFVTARHWGKRLDPSPKASIPANTSSKPVALWPSAMHANGSAGPKQSGSGRFATSPSSG